MEWVIAALAMGCVFFTIQVVVDYYKHRSLLGPRIEELEQARAGLEQRLEQAKEELAQRRDRLDPLRAEIDALEQERTDIDRQLAAVRARRQADLPVRRRDAGGQPRQQQRGEASGGGEIA